MADDAGVAAAASDAFGDVVEALHMPRNCVQCGETTTEYLTLGALRCRRHDAPLGGTDTLPEPFTYPCCGVSDDVASRAYAGRAYARGCVRSDHSLDGEMPTSTAMRYEDARFIWGEALGRRRYTLDDESGVLTFVRAEADSPHMEIDRLLAAAAAAAATAP